MPSGFGKAYLDFSKTMDWFSYSSIPGEKESPLLLPILDVTIAREKA